MDANQYRAVANVMVDGLTVYYGRVYTEDQLAPSLDELLRTGCVVSTRDDLDACAPTAAEAVVVCPAADHVDR